MKVAVVYTCVPGRDASLYYATRFVASYHAHQPGFPCDLFYCCNGGKLESDCTAALSILGGRFIERSNHGWDIGGYIHCAYSECKDYDAILCLGESVYFHRQKWLERLADAWKQGGSGMYGPFATFVVRPHILTTAFMTTPELLRRYPHHVESKKQRYQFEHGVQSFGSWVMLGGKSVRLVTWDGSWGKMNWRSPGNIIWRGDQSNCLMLCNHTDTYAKSDRDTKIKWGRMADTLS